MGVALNRMRERMSEVVDRIARTSVTLSSASEELSAVSDEMSSAAEQTSDRAGSVSAAAEQVSGGGSLGGNATPGFSYYENYVTNPGGFGGANQGNVFMQAADEVGNLVFGGGSGGKI